MLKTSDVTEPPVKNPLVTQAGNCFGKFVDTLDQHIPTLDNQISNNIIGAMNTSDKARIDKEEGTKKCSRFYRAKDTEQYKEHRRHKRQKLRNNYCRDKSQIQQNRKAREVSSNESSEDDQFSCQNDDNEVDYLPLPSENEMDRKIKKQ